MSDDLFAKAGTSQNRNKDKKFVRPSQGAEGEDDSDDKEAMSAHFDAMFAMVGGARNSETHAIFGVGESSFKPRDGRTASVKDNVAFFEGLTKTKGEQQRITAKFEVSYSRFNVNPDWPKLKRISWRNWREKIGEGAGVTLRRQCQVSIAIESTDATNTARIHY